MFGARGRREESWLDSALRFAPLLPPVVRLWAARRAAARGLGEPALRAAAGDPMVLARLGLIQSASVAPGGGRVGVVARAAASGAMGELDPTRALQAAAQRLSRADRRFLAASVAPFDSRLAFDLLPESDQVDRAACALADQDFDTAALCIEAAGQAAGTRFLQGALSSWRGDWRAARVAFNEAFLADGLAPPLREDSDRPTLLEAFLENRVPACQPGPLVTVVVAARDAEQTLPLAVGSLTAQTWRDLEILIVDDASSDATMAIGAALARHDTRIRVLSNTRRRGAYGARNTGITAARGAFIALHDADDWAHPQRIERQMTALGQAKGLTVCRYFRLDRDGRALCPRVFPFVRLSPIAMVARAEVWSAVGLFEEVALGADSEWLARFDARCGRRAGPRTMEVGMVALWQAGSLSVAPATGFVGEGLRRRLAYVESWRRRHAGLAID